MQGSEWIKEMILGTGVAIFPSIGFIFQHQLISSRKSVGTFSINVCGVMFLSNFLRISFFIYKEFSIALLIQSILNIIMQILLLRLCIQTMNFEGCFQKVKNNDEEVCQSLFKPFWKWKQTNKYMNVIVLGGLSIMALGALIRKLQIEDAGQVLGYAALTAETFLLIPQLIQNLQQKQVKGISYFFVCLNTFQDLLELIFVVIYSQPLQFVVFNVLQVLANILLILQIAFYKHCCLNGGELKQVTVTVDHYHLNSQEQIETHRLNHQQASIHQPKISDSHLNPFGEHVLNTQKRLESPMIE